MNLRESLLDTMRDLRARAPQDAHRTTYQLARLLALRGLCEDVPDLEDVHAALLSLYDDGYADYDVPGWIACERRQSCLALECAGMDRMP